jgi:hypothetical protein
VIPSVAAESVVLAVVAAAFVVTVLAVVAVLAVALLSSLPRSSCRRVKQPDAAVSTKSPVDAAVCGYVVHSTGRDLRGPEMTKCRRAVPAGSALPVSVGSADVVVHVASVATSQLATSSSH